MYSIIRDSDYMDMEIGMAYRFLNNRSVLTEMHTHNYYEYFIITSGQIYHIVNGKTSLLGVNSPRLCGQHKKAPGAGILSFRRSGAA